MEIVAFKDAPEVLAATMRAIVADPLPKLGPETVIQLGKLEIVHAQAASSG